LNSRGGAPNLYWKEPYICRKEIEMHANEADSQTSTQATTQRYFTVEQAEGTLVLVRRITRDLVREYADLMRLRSQREECALALDERERLDDLNLLIDEKARRLQALLEEMEDVGCQAKDLVTGLIDFPALFEGRKVWICWRLDEPAIAWWHELEAGFAGRKAIDEAFRRAVQQDRAVAASPSELS
jgi:hypothetical protein